MTAKSTTVNSLNYISVGQAKALLAILNVVGLVGLLYPLSRPWFLALVPANLVITVAVLLLFQVWTKKLIVAAIAVTAIGYFVEVAGVKTGLLFGIYTYGNALGFKALNVPIIMGLNWLMLALAAVSITSGFKVGVVWQVVAASVLMTLLDAVMELMAPRLDFWYWQNNLIPARNFAGWLITSAVITAILRYSSTLGHNPLAKTVLGLQLAFFTALLVLWPN